MAQLQIGPVAGLPALQNFEVQSQDSTGNLVQDGIRDLAPVIGLLKHPLVGRAAELHVQTVQVGSHLVGVDGAAIGDDYTVIAPFVPKNVLHEVTVGVDPLVVHLVVGGHDGPWVPLLDGDFKGPEVDLPEGALADNGVGPHAVIHSPGKCRDQGIDDAARQHDDPGHRNRQHHGILNELGHEIHRGQNDAEINHDEDGAGPEGRLGEDSEVQDWFIKLQLTSCIKDEYDDADGKKTEHPW